jgi:hypothetical protein
MLLWLRTRHSNTLKVGDVASDRDRGRCAKEVGDRMQDAVKRVREKFLETHPPIDTGVEPEPYLETPDPEAQPQALLRRLSK